MRMVFVEEGWGGEGEWPPVSMAAASGVALPVYVCVSATGTQHAHRGQRKGEGATLP